MPPIAIVPQSILDVFEDILRFWHDLIGGGENSWGFAIILLTFTVRLVILPLTFRSVKSMQKLQVLQPEIKKIQARYKEDRQRMNQEMMRFYQENKVNPLGSCLPLLLQLPFFLALFELLRSDSFKADIEGQESFFFIPDLAENLTGEPAILALMVVLYVGTQLVASLITAIGGDKMQQRIMFALPFIFVIFVINFEAGLIVYWITTNVWTIGQQLVVRKLYPRPVILSEDEDKDEDKRANGKGGSGARAETSDDGDNGGGRLFGRSKPAPVAAAPVRVKAPPVSPKKKKKRSGRRR